MENFVQDGKVINVVASGAKVSGGVHVFTGVGCGVYAADIASGATGAVKVEGVFSFVKAAGGGTAIAQGARVYWTGSAATGTASTNTLMGFCTKAATDDDVLVEVKLTMLADSDPLNLSQAAVVAALGTTSNLVGVDGTGSNAAPLVGTEARLDAIEAKVDAILSSLKTAGLMASS